MLTRCSTHTILHLLAFTWRCEELRNGVNTVNEIISPALDLTSAQADASSHTVRHSYLVFPAEPPYVSSKPRRNFIAILGTFCSRHYLSWPSKWGAGWERSLYLGQILIFFSFTPESLPPISSRLFFRFAFQLLVEHLSVILSCPLQPRAESFVLNRMAFFFIFSHTFLFHPIYHIPTSDWCNTMTYLKPQKLCKLDFFFFSYLMAEQKPAGEPLM